MGATYGLLVGGIWTSHITFFYPFWIMSTVGDSLNKKAEENKTKATYPILNEVFFRSNGWLEKGFSKKIIQLQEEKVGEE
jgi:hypothetical protein